MCDINVPVNFQGEWRYFQSEDNPYKSFLPSPTTACLDQAANEKSCGLENNLLFPFILAIIFTNHAKSHYSVLKINSKVPIVKSSQTDCSANILK